jgi:hypothetical protein
MRPRTPVRRFCERNRSTARAPISIALAGSCISANLRRKTATAPSAPAPACRFPQ